MICINNADAKIVFHKSNGGFFGYKFVTSTDWGNGTVVVACTDPGKTRCKMASAALVTPTGPELSPDAFLAIDKTVSSLLSPENTSGKLVYNNSLFVTYKYDVELDDLLVTIYSMDEAKKLGLI